MSQLLSDVLSSRNYAEPPEIALIKKFVLKEVGVNPKVSITTESLVIYVNSAAAAGTLRTKVFELQKQLDTKKRLQIRIS